MMDRDECRDSKNASMTGTVKKPPANIYPGKKEIEHAALTSGRGD
jgi:hypothetical protein